MKIWHNILIVVGCGLVVITCWTLFANAKYRQDNRELKDWNDRLAVENKKLIHRSDSIVQAVVERLKEDSVRTVQIEALKMKLESLNNRNIVTVYENYHTVTALDLDGDIAFLSRFVGAAAEDTIPR